MTDPSPARRYGFSLIEMLIASVAASVLALTAGTLLVLAWKSWSAMQEGIEMQRDASIALASIRHTLHDASADEVSIVNGVQLQVARPDATARYYQLGTDFLFDPDIAKGGNETKLIVGRVNDFAPSATNLTGRVTVTVGLDLFGDVGHETTTLSTTVGLRN